MQPKQITIYTKSADETNLNPYRNYCHKTEDNLPLFTTCSRIQNIWKYFQPIYNKLAKKAHTPQEHILTLSSNNLNSNNNKLVLTLTQIIIYEIWQARNNLKYDNSQLTQKTIINKIITQIQAILNTHYNHHKEQDTLDQFDASFCINRAIAILNGNKLQINI